MAVAAFSDDAPLALAKTIGSALTFHRGALRAAVARATRQQVLVHGEVLSTVGLCALLVELTGRLRQVHSLIGRLARQMLAVFRDPGVVVAFEVKLAHNLILEGLEDVDVGFAALGKELLCRRGLVMLEAAEVVKAVELGLWLQALELGAGDAVGSDSCY